MLTKVSSLKMIRMALYWGKKVTISFDSWRTDSLASYHLSLLALFAVAAFHQCMEDIRARFKLLSASRSSPPLPRSSSQPPQPPGSGRLLGP